MTTDKTLYELGEEYERSAMTVKLRIAERLKRLHALQAQGKMLTDDAYVLKCEISRLYREFYDASMIANHLKNYYDRDEPDAAELFGI